MAYASRLHFPLTVFLMVFVSLSFLTVTAWATFSKKNDPQILEVFINPDLTEVLILRKHFPANPEVSLGEQGLLNVTFHSKTEIRADLPEGPVK